MIDAKLIHQYLRALDELTKEGNEAAKVVRDALPVTPSAIDHKGEFIGAISLMD